MTDTDLARPDTSFDRFSRVIRAAVGVPTALVTLVEADRQVFPGAVGLPPRWQASRQTPLSHSFCQYVVADRAALVVDDAREDPRLRGNLAIADLGVVAYAGVPLRDDTGEVIGSVCAIDSQPHHWTPEQLETLEDIAGICSTELTLRATREALDRSHGDLTMFAGQLSHDLKTPLTAILGFVELHADALTDGSITTERAVGYLARCEASGRRMEQTIDDLLAYASIGGSLNREPVALGDVMPPVVDDLGHDTATADIRWQGEELFADRTLLRVLLQNLVGNAVKYRRAAGPCVIEVRVVHAGDTDRLTVADNGRGVPAASRADVLQPLVQLHDDLPGTGLGLATCVRIVTAHGGTLRLEETPGGGCTVVVDLPAHP